MSYDICLRINTGGQYEAYVTETITPTYNLGGMFHKALGFPISDLRGKTASETSADLERAVTAMESNREHFEQFNPPNGWGNFDDALATLNKMKQWAREHPKAHWNI